MSSIKYVTSVMTNVLSNRKVIQMFTLQKKIRKSNNCIQQTSVSGSSPKPVKTSGTNDF